MKEYFAKSLLSYNDINMVHPEYFNPPKSVYDKTEVDAEISKRDKRIEKIEEALVGLLDGLDANCDERYGLTQKQWDGRVKKARKALEDKEE